jgi:hypothetical protein
MKNENMVVDPQHVMDDACKHKFDQVAVIGKRGDEYAIWSSHGAELMEDMIDEALDRLYDGELSDLDDEE